MPNPITTLTTARLPAEAINPSHFPEIHRLHSDPQVMKILSADGKPLSEEATRDSIRQAVDHWQQHGFGFWVFHRRLDGVFIGRGGLKTYQIDGKDIIGLAYAVISDYWNQGFATEMAQARDQQGGWDSPTSDRGRCRPIWHPSESWRSWASGTSGTSSLPGCCIGSIGW
jgi:RimJ/RimL family protein N-acetyltransferase